MAQRYGDHKLVLVCGVISAEHGLCVAHIEEKSEEHKGFNRWDMITVLEKLRHALPEENIGLFWDNATIHRAKDTE